LGGEWALLNLKGVHAFYGYVHVLRGIDIEVKEGEIVCLLGTNGAGKTTTLKSIMGLVDALEGEILFLDQPIKGLLPYRVVNLGIAFVPEGRRIFPDLTVIENLMMGAYIQHNRKRAKESMEYVFSIFPKLKERQWQRGGTLSGGEQQMLAIGRALMSQGRLLLMDEPSMGLAPIVREEIFCTITTINQGGTSILLVEQNAVLASAVSHRGYVMETGQVVFSGTAKELTTNEEVARAYLGKK
jgi:branched-chain amino acid transport system ATP-binding protein